MSEATNAAPPAAEPNRPLFLQPLAISAELRASDPHFAAMVEAYNLAAQAFEAQGVLVTALHEQVAALKAHNAMLSAQLSSSRPAA